MEIKLGGKKGGITIVSEDDFELVSKYKWYQNNSGYVIGKINRKNYLIHRFLLNPSDNEEIDHINHNILDNRRENLRIMTPQEHKKNQKMKKLDSSSKYFGVQYIKKIKKYEALVHHDGKKHIIGYSESEIKAAEMRDIYILQNKFNNLQLNFPEKKEIYETSNHVIECKQRSSKYIGVCKKSNGKFRAVIYVNKKSIEIGYSMNEKDCAIMYDDYIVKNNIPNKKLNFPENYNYNTKNIKTQYENLDENTIKLLIPNNQDKCIKIDKQDYDLIKYYTCSINKQGYIRVFIGNNHKCKLLHRIIMNVDSPNILIDHINGDTMDNTRKNLRLSDCKKNAQNKSKNKNKCTSQYIGINYEKKTNRWRGTIVLNYKVIYRKQDNDEISSARRRDLYILENLKDTHFKLNFEWTDTEIIEWKTKLNC
ncbi:HNH endonuclease [Fadolivirus algeromassiliense]|jgi:hypothetical protein|uniref:HNH endonuclease n=1 Tax=Fadolivirus FV1/VV64 TaxID=3070911 RepID=A0A7D3R232_9VIRU|nr:HNH endonuclease [Fadolivirus algeromassiliense]QKF94198.1 HNH endonuclease [Fadolivirus FV1/VV64]